MKYPVNEKAEIVVLGGMLNDEECYYEGTNYLTHEDFTNENALKLFEHMANESRYKNYSTLLMEFEDASVKSYIKTATKTYEGKRSFQDAVMIANEYKNKRNMYHRIQKAQQTFDESDFHEIHDILQFDDFSVKKDDVVNQYDYMPDFLEMFFNKVANPNENMGLPFSYRNERGDILGFEKLDATFNGAQGGDLYMIAAKTGEGKTALAIQLSRFFSYQSNHKGFYINTEMKKESIMSRYMASICNLNIKEVLHGRLEGTKEEKEKKTDRVSAVSQEIRDQDNFIISRIPDLTLQKTKALSHKLKVKHPDLSYLVVDYIGRIDTQGYKGESWDQLYYITQQLKELAMTLDIPVFMLAQRNQAGDVEGAKKMMNECDGVFFFQPIEDDDQEYIHEHIMHSQKKMINYKIRLRKVRDGESEQNIYCVFDKSKGRITELK